jgi:hypothetical protein
MDALQVRKTLNPMNPPNPPNASPQSMRAAEAINNAWSWDIPLDKVGLIIDAEFAPLLAAVNLAVLRWSKEPESCCNSEEFTAAMSHLARFSGLAHPHATATGETDQQAKELQRNAKIAKFFAEQRNQP